MSKETQKLIDEQNKRCAGCGDPAEISSELRALQMAYRKHWLNDDSIGWEELGDILLDALCNIMGADEFIAWKEAKK